MAAPRPDDEQITKTFLDDEQVTRDADLESDGEDPTRDRLQKLQAHRSSDPRYRSVDELGHGGMGTVLRVWDDDLRRHLAMKVVSDGSAPTDKRQLARFLSEAQITGQLDHPGVVPVHELGLDTEGRVYFTMQLVRGRNLKEIAELVHSGAEGWNLTRAVGVMLKVCEAMAYAHAKGVIHRDLKPANIMVGKFGETYVVDWGLATLMRGGRPADDEGAGERTVETDRHANTQDHASQGPTLRTQAGQVLGTPPYMPPEQATGRLGEMGFASDIYSVGANLYHLMVGHAPYIDADRPASGVDVLGRVIAGPPAPVESLNAAVSPELVAICEKAMARLPAQRYPSMLEMAEDLRAYLEGRVVKAHRTGALVEFRKWVRRNRGFAAALAGLVLLALVATSGFAWLQRQRVQEVQELTDVVSSRAYVDQADEVEVPDEQGLARMGTWVERVEQLLSRKENYVAALGRATEDDLGAAEIAELEATVGYMDRLEPRLERMRERMAVVESLRATTLERHADDWRSAIEAIAGSPDYGGLRIAPQLGLVPLGRNEATGLWEFWHVLSGGRPAFDGGGGGSRSDPESGIALVLLPGGKFMMGSPEDEQGRRPSEVLHEVDVDPFFMGKFEVTQAQYERTMGDNPSYFAPGTTREDPETGEVMTRVTSLHPVESIDWFRADALASRLGLSVPTEEQWEYACRAGTGSAYSWGDDHHALRDRENVADHSYGILAGNRNFQQLADWNDGFPLHSPVGSYLANGFGLHDLHGNIEEWTADEYRPAYDSETRSGYRVLRGGTYYIPPWLARSAIRHPATPGTANQMTGVRLSRTLAIDDVRTD